MSDPRIATPQEASLVLATPYDCGKEVENNLARTVATEPDRTRAAVVKALRVWATSGQDALAYADDIENGAPL